MTNNNDELIEQIRRLKKETKAIILSHNYQLGEVQDIADFVGDSLELSQKAAKTDADVIVFCGVHFMAETVSILCPHKTVLLPDIHAGCPLANMITPQRLLEKKTEYPQAVVMCYINSSAAVKAESDICCTSANTVRLVQKVPLDKEILFVPDQYLGSFAAGETGRKMILWPGYCPTHVRIQPQDILRLRTEHPHAKVVAHPECRTEVTGLADAVLSTGGMIRFARESEAKEIIIGTEIGILHRLRKENPGKSFIPVSEQAVCPRMKLITLETILWSLESMEHQVKVPEETRLRAKRAVDRMLEVL
ncbi:MAG: quinolinate synthase [Dehalococcoidales bacterium]|jgi:quinolinate synthase|nr:quinolinate synthase [Dehalococcoidales bacterium]MDP6222157.1 quinolinate synthase NadA [Dehalococcoidales bacterium]MDP7309651.1 quinolinate synthase NadA [Dehalococcoidales bacterium]MDP7409416.1 quinolinate synthase NadA [Dehalococcoidales bacterium]MDP7675751.1 quinolinate synthase NadA [Dehalococcoidales bacterium]|tara:strand:- start:1753 stop:2670 length:918 start_codon:yes stop_codon:yes gene_type:complete